MLREALLDSRTSRRPSIVTLRFSFEPAELAEAALADVEAEPADRALVALTCMLLHASEHPESLTAARLATLAPLIRTVLDQGEPAASEDLRTLWRLVDACFDARSPARTLIVDAVNERANERFASIVAGSVIALGPH